MTTAPSGRTGSRTPPVALKQVPDPDPAASDPEPELNSSGAPEGARSVDIERYLSRKNQRLSRAEDEADQLGAVVDAQDAEIAGLKEQVDALTSALQTAESRIVELGG